MCFRDKLCECAFDLQVFDSEREREREFETYFLLLGRSQHHMDISIVPNT